MVTSWGIGGVIVRTLSRNARDVGSNPTLGATFPNFHHPNYTKNAKECLLSIANLRKGDLYAGK